MWSMLKPGGEYEPVLPLPSVPTFGIPCLDEKLSKLDVSLVQVQRNDASDGQFVVYRRNIHVARPHARVIPASEWHTNRRRARVAPPPNDPSMNVQRAVLVGLVTCQLLGALIITQTSTAVVCAALCGGFLHFGLQQMMHELSHRRMRAFDMVLCVLADACFGMSGPCFYVYYTELHGLHHSTVGDHEDPDTAFHNLWSLSGPLGRCGAPMRLLWTCVVGFLTRPLVLIASAASGRSDLLDKASGRRFRGMLLYSVTALVWLGLLYACAPAGVLYMVLSAGFSMGACAHPCLLYWIMQHCASPITRMQPTVSYGGSAWMHALTFGALRHVEHHDFPLVPFYRLHEIASLVGRPPRVTDSPPRPVGDEKPSKSCYSRNGTEDGKLFVVESACGFIWQWLSRRGEWMDVGAQQFCKEHNTALKVPTPAERRALALLPAHVAASSLFPFTM